MSNLQDRLILEESCRNYRTESPNVVFELVRAGKLTPNEYFLYMTYRRIAGEHGECWAGIERIKEYTGFCRSSVIEFKKKLAQPFAELNNKPLIKIQKQPKHSNLADVITIVDIWRENHEFFKNKLTWSKKQTPTPSKNQTIPVQNSNPKNEPVKKEPYIKKKSKEAIVHKSVPDSLVSSPSSAAPPTSPTLAEGSNSFLAEGIKEQQHLKEKVSWQDSDDLPELLSLEEEYIKHFRSKIVSFWINKFGPTQVLRAIKYFFEIMKKQKKPIDNKEAWMERNLKDEYYKNTDLSQANKLFAQEYKQKHKTRDLKILKNYCSNTQNGESFYYSLPKETFEHLLRREFDDNYE